MLDMSDVINDKDFQSSFNRIPVTGAFANGGLWTATEGAAQPMTGCVLPASAGDLNVLPEGERVSDAIVLYTLTPLAWGDEQQTIQSDLIEYNSLWYRVAHSNFYQQGPLYFQIATRFQRASVQ